MRPYQTSSTSALSNFRLFGLLLAVAMSGLVASAAHAAAIVRIVVKEPDLGNPTGHVYVEIDPPNGAATVAWGMAPAKKNYLFQAGSTGFIRNDLGYAWTYYVKFDITDAEYNRIARRINFYILTPPNYALLKEGRDHGNETNCVGFGILIMQAIHANTTIPPTTNDLNIHDPAAYAKMLQTMGAGSTWNTVRQDPAFPNDPTKTKPLVGTVFVNPNPLTFGAGGGCFSPGYTEVEGVAHTNPSLLTSLTDIPNVDYPLPGPINVSLASGVNVDVSGIDVNRTLVSMNWGDNKDPQNPEYTGQSLSMHHVYASEGTYDAVLVVMNDMYIRRYQMTFNVGVGSQSVQVIIGSEPPWPPVDNNCPPGETPTVCLADLNGDGSVGVPDLLIIIGGWGNCPAAPTFCLADLDQTFGSGVNVFDLLTLINNWGPCSP